jgi:hypothetical protein
LPGAWRLTADGCLTPQDYVSFTDHGGEQSSVEKGFFASKLGAISNPFFRKEEEEVHRSDAPQEYEYSDGDTVLSVSKAIRLGFLRKVYGILSVQLAVTALVCAIAMKAVAAAKVGITPSL